VQYGAPLPLPSKEKLHNGRNLFCDHIGDEIQLRYDTISEAKLFYVRSNADISELNLPHGTNN